MRFKFPLSIPTWENGEWSETVFATRPDFSDFVANQFKKCGEYELDETSFNFNAQARHFNKTEKFCHYVEGSDDYIDYWDDQKKKCRKGAIFKNGDKQWYLPGFYYMWLNFLKIYNKQEKKFTFPDVRDLQYHISLYEFRAEVVGKHGVVLKKRQCASSYLHTAKLINRFWFEEASVSKMAASNEDFINMEGSWRFLEEYRDFLNKETGWKRACNPNKVLNWQQKLETKDDETGHKSSVGNKSIIVGLTLERSPTAGVGGACDEFFHEEGGIAKQASQTYIFAKQAMKDGQIITGIFIIAGSVGDLKDCEPLCDFMYYPEENGFLGVETDLMDGKGTIGVAGLFIPEHWSMPPFIDEFGNSLVAEALASLNAELDEKKKTMSPEDYQLEVSQRPRNIAEAFATRTVSKYRPDLVSYQLRRIEDGEIPVEYVDLVRGLNGKIDFVRTDKKPISDFPISKTLADKTGVICIKERPIANAPWGTYFASVDTIDAGKTVTSVSLCSIYIYKNAVQIIDTTDGDEKNYIERGEIVAWWCGRFDDIKHTHERLEIMIDAYNAWTTVEANKGGQFFQYMIGKRKHKFLVPKDQMVFSKDIDSSRNNNNNQNYGWWNNGTIFTTMLGYGIEYTQEELDTELDENGNIKKIKFGIERIPDPMLLKEMQVYDGKMNADRIIAYSALIALVEIQASSRGHSVRKIRRKPTDLENKGNMSKLNNRTPFNNYGANSKSLNGFPNKRQAYKNLQ